MVSKTKGYGFKSYFTCGRTAAKPKEGHTIDYLTSLARHFASLGAHLGHRTNKRNPGCATHIFVTRNGIHIIDLEQTIPMLRRGLGVAKRVTRQRGKIWVALRARPDWRSSWVDVSSTAIPEALFLLNIKQNLPLLRSSIKLQIAIIAIVNTEGDPSGIKYPIPANDASREIYKGLLLSAVCDSRHQEQKLLATANRND